nr:HemK/PrmC family methyltransferase [Nanchangia anserum]
MAHALHEGAYVLAEAGVDAPMADARVLAEHVIGAPLYAAAGDLDDAAWSRYMALIGRRAAREPLQHITQRMAFRFLDLHARDGVFVVRPETEWVVDSAIERSRHLVDAGRRPLVLDWCAGSGAIGIALATEVAGIDVIAVEIDAAACDLARLNAREHVPAPGSTWNLVHADACDEQVLAEYDGDVDIIVTNPPYVVADTISQPEALRDPARALYGGGPDGLDVPRALVRRAQRALAADGLLVMEHGEEQGPALVEAARACGFEARACRDATGRVRWLEAYSPGAQRS